MVQSLNFVVVKGSVFVAIITAAVVTIAVAVAGVLDSKAVVDYSNSVALLPFLVVELQLANFICAPHRIIVGSPVFICLLHVEQIFFSIEVHPFKI